jgi:drug/metabolite transporter (DMT)-like permease
MAAALAFAVVSTALAYVLFFRLLARVGGTNAMLVTLLIPVSGVALAAGVLGERLDAGEAAGMALIAAALLILDGRAALWLKRRLAAEQA